MKHHDKPITCPHCGSQHTSTTGIDQDEPPNDGDVGFCLTCGQWGIFVVKGGEMTKRVLTDDELMEIHLDPVVRSMEKIWLDAKDTLTKDKIKGNTQ